MTDTIKRIILIISYLLELIGVKLSLQVENVPLVTGHNPPLY